MKRKISITVEDSLLKDVDEFIDHITIRNRSQAIEFLVQQALGDNKTAVILAGGPEENLELGKFYRPTVLYKKKSVVERAIRTLRHEGFKTIYVVARHNVLTAIFSLLKEGDHLDVRIHYIEEKSGKGTMDSLRLLKGNIQNTFLVVYADILFEKVNIEQIWNDHLIRKGVATIMLTTSNKPKEKGTVVVEGNKVLAFKQKPKASEVYLVFSPLFVAEPALLSYHGVSLEDDVFPLLAERELLYGHLSSEKETHVHTMKDVK